MALLLLCRQRASWSPPCYRKNKATGNCTELCATKHSGSSCPNICLISIYVKTNLDEKIRTYVVINNQSNCSLAKQLTIDSYAISYTLKHALVNLSCRIAQNPQASLGNWMRRYPKQQEKNSYASGWQSTPSSQSNCQQGLWTGCRCWHLAVIREKCVTALQGTRIEKWLRCLPWAQRMGDRRQSLPTWHSLTC